MHRIFFMLMLLPVMSGRPVEAAPAGVQVTVVSQGIKLTLSLPNQTYPRNSLVRATVRIQNLAHRVVYVLPGNGVTVMDASRTVAYPPVFLPLAGFSPFPGCACPPLPPVVASSDPRLLRFRGTYSYTQTIILRAEEVQASVGITRPTRVSGGWKIGASTTVSTPPVVLSLTSAPAPTATVHFAPAGPTTPAEWYVVVHPPAGVHGDLVYAAEAQCTEFGSTQFIGATDWSVTPILDQRIHLHCQGTLHQLRVVAGWFGHPVMELDMMSPSKSS
jgi:hypothetical protein